MRTLAVVHRNDFFRRGSEWPLYLDVSVSALRRNPPDNDAHPSPLPRLPACAPLCFTTPWNWLAGNCFFEMVVPAFRFFSGSPRALFLRTPSFSRVQRFQSNWSYCEPILTPLSLFFPRACAFFETTIHLIYTQPFFACLNPTRRSESRGSP